MAHSEHNKRNNAGFVLIILGSLLLFLAPNIHPVMPTMGVLSFVAGLIIGLLGFYLKFVHPRLRRSNG